MRKLMAAAVAVAALAGAGIGHAEDPLVLSGSIDVGTLGENQTQANAACDPASDENGFDGIWFSVSGQDGRDALLELPDTNDDADVYFYDAECAQIDDTSMAQNFIAAGRAPFETNTEEGSVPEGTAHIFVGGFFGLDIEFTLTITDPPPAE